VVAEIYPPHQPRSAGGQHLKHFNDGLGRGAGDATNRLLQHAHLRLSRIRSLKQHCGGENWPAGQRDRGVLQKHCTKPVCHRMAFRRVVQQCVGMSEFLGYARVSTAEQTAVLQEDALRAAGCQRIWSDTASGTRTDRPQLAAVFDQLRAGDTLVVWRLDRLGRSLPHLIETIGALEARGVGFKSVQENIDTTTPGGRLVFHFFGALASFERELIQERTLAGLAAARERGRLGGRPTVLSPAKLKQARRMIGEKTPVTEVAQVLGVSRATLYRRVPELAEARTRPVMNEPDAGVSSPP